MRHTLKFAAIAATVVLAVWLLFACGPAAKTNIAVNTNLATSPLTTPDEFAAGRDLYQQNCTKCHQDSGAGGRVTIDGKELNLRT